MGSSLPPSMRAAEATVVTGGIENNLKLNTSAPLPRNATALPKDSALIKVEYSSLNPIDYKYPESFPTRLLVSKPHIPCGDYAGTVVSTTLPNLSPGDRVFGHSDPPALGTLGEYAVVSGTENVILLPKGASTRDAATIGVAGLTAYQCLAPYVQPGSKVFINGGSGGTGMFGIQMAKILGCTVTTTCSGPNVELCKDLGADQVIDYRTTDVVDHLKRQGTQYDLLIDNVAAPSPVYWGAHHYLKPEGRYITIAGSITLSSSINLAKMQYLPTWLGGGQRIGQFLLRKSSAKDFAKIAEWLDEGKLKVVTEKVYKLEEAGDAFARLKTGRSKGKLVIRVTE